MKKISRRNFLAVAGAAAATLALTACGGSSSSTAAPASSTAGAASAFAGTDSAAGTGVMLTIYTNSGSDGRGEWLQERAAKDGFKIQFIDAGAADTQNRLLAEAASPIADVVYGLNTIIWENLKAEGILTPFVPVWADEVSAGLNDPDGYYHAIVKQAILLVYDQNQMSAAEAPTDWLDLWTKPEFKGKYEYLTGLGGGTVRNVLAGILTRFTDPNGDLGISAEGWENIAQYYQCGVPNESGVDLYGQISNPASTVVCGQMWSSGIAARDEQYGTKTGYVVPKVGVPYATEAISIVNGTKNLEEAQRFVNWFGSAEVQGEWAQQFSTLPANEKAVPMANEFNQEIAKIPAQDIDWTLVAQNIDAWCEKILLEYMP